MTEMLLKVALITITVTPWLRQMNQIARIYYPLMRWRLYLVCTVLNITIYATWGGFLKYQVVTLTVHRKTCCSIWIHYNATLTVYRKTCCSIWIHYNDSRPASSKWYSLMFCVHSWNLLSTRTKKKFEYQRCNQKPLICRKTENTIGKRRTIEPRSVWRYQRGNQIPYIQEEQTTQWSKEKVQQYKQWSTKHYTENKKPQANADKVSSSCSTYVTHRVTVKRDKHHAIRKWCCTSW